MFVNTDISELTVHLFLRPCFNTLQDQNSSSLIEIKGERGYQPYQFLGIEKGVKALLVTTSFKNWALPLKRGKIKDYGRILPSGLLIFISHRFHH